MLGPISDDPNTAPEPLCHSGNYDENPEWAGKENGEGLCKALALVLIACGAAMTLFAVAIKLIGRI